MSHKITGQYTGGRFVLVKGAAHQDRLKTLGNFGSDTAQASRKQAKRRGPEDKDICALGGSQQDNDDAITALNLSEAFFLVHALGCLDLVRDSLLLNPLSCWQEFVRFYDGSHHRIAFPIEYAVYYYLRTRGWVVKSGENYGTSFLLYRRGPSIDHATYAVVIIRADKTDSYSWLSLLTYNRVVQGVSKELLIAFVSAPEDFESVHHDPSCIKKMTVDFLTFSSRTNHIEKNTDVLSGVTKGKHNS